jgi:hypothetical protein
MDSLLELFCNVDDFCKEFRPESEKKKLPNGKIHRNRRRNMTISEMMTILIAFHQSGYRNFKAFYCEHVSRYWWSEFSSLFSYNRFVQLMPSVSLVSEPLVDHGIRFITKFKSNMKNLIFNMGFPIIALFHLGKWKPVFSHPEKK